jgi:hypothetical protein
VWLLVSAGMPGVGTSTFLPYFHIGSDDLNHWTAAILCGSKYARAFLHVIMGDTLFEWDLHSGWRKLVGRIRLEYHLTSGVLQAGAHPQSEAGPCGAGSLCSGDRSKR